MQFLKTIYYYVIYQMVTEIAAASSPVDIVVIGQSAVVQWQF